MKRKAPGRCEAQSLYLSPEFARHVPVHETNHGSRDLLWQTIARIPKPQMATNGPVLGGSTHLLDEVILNSIFTCNYTVRPCVSIRSPTTIALAISGRAIN